MNIAYYVSMVDFLQLKAAEAKCLSHRYVPSHLVGNRCKIKPRYIAHMQLEVSMCVCRQFSHWGNWIDTTSRVDLMTCLQSVKERQEV